MDNFFEAEHNELLVQELSNFSELPKGIQEYLLWEQLKEKQHMKYIQTPYTAATQAKEKEQEQIREQQNHKKARKTKKQQKQVIESERVCQQKENKRMQLKAVEQETEKEKEKEKVWICCKIDRLECVQ